MGWRFPSALRATWELHASVHEPTRGTSLFQICVTAFAYISILSSVCVFAFAFFFPSTFHMNSVTGGADLLCRRSQLVLWQAYYCMMDTQRRVLPMLVNQALYPIMIDRVWIQSDLLHMRSATDDKSPPDNNCQFLLFPMLSVAPSFSFTQPVKIHLV